MLPTAGSSRRVAPPHPAGRQHSAGHSTLSPPLSYNTSRVLPAIGGSGSGTTSSRGGRPSGAQHLSACSPGVSPRADLRSSRAKGGGGQGLPASLSAKSSPRPRVRRSATYDPTARSEGRSPLGAPRSTHSESLPSLPRSDLSRPWGSISPAT